MTSGTDRQVGVSGEYLVTPPKRRRQKQSSATETSQPFRLVAIRSVNSLATPDGTALLLLENFHRFLSSAEIVQALAQQILAGKQNRTIVVILAPVVQLPVELENLFVVIEHELPDREQLTEIARGIATEPSELPNGQELETVLDAAAGLTRLEAENAFSLSLVRQGKITSDTVWELKSGMLKKSGLLELHRGREDFGGSVVWHRSRASASGHCCNPAAEIPPNVPKVSCCCRRRVAEKVSFVRASEPRLGDRS
ncbi:MAG: ATPase central domain protein [Schlesneria sp.]|nr:ATPase central domain protein [Schlesneria sp.]